MYKSLFLHLKLAFVMYSSCFLFDTGPSFLTIRKSKVIVVKIKKNFLYCICKLCKYVL
jgi:hypothetical protein